MLLKAFCLLIIFFCAAAFGRAQDVPQSVQPQKVLQQLQFDVTTPDDVIKLYGTPKADDVDELDSEIFDPWLKIKKNQKAFRKLTYKNLSGVEQLFFRFYENKLVKVTFDFKENKSNRMLAHDLQDSFKTDFLRIDGIPKESKISDYEGQKENTIPKVYPGIYLMLSVQPNNIYYAIVANTGFKALWKQLRAKPETQQFPGFVVELQIISRSLEAK